MASDLPDVAMAHRLDDDQPAGAHGRSSIRSSMLMTRPP